MRDLITNEGFTVNVHGDAFDRGNYRVYFDDTNVHVIKFNNQKSQLIEWDSVVDLNMGEKKAMQIINAMTS